MNETKDGAFAAHNPTLAETGLRRAQVTARLFPSILAGAASAAEIFPLAMANGIDNPAYRRVTPRPQAAIRYGSY